jgi:Asp-tRNA(Asn)/Glu-tRNA(Gln) amidotransferase A subunit family amidase
VLAVPEGPYLDRASEEGRAAFAAQLARLERAGVTVRRVPFFAGFEELERGHRRLMAAEAAQVHEGWYTRFADRYSRHMHAIMETGRAVDETEQARLRRARLELRESLDAALSRQGADLWAAPAAAGPAPEGIASTGDPIMSLPWTNAGVPNLTLPAGAARNGLPLGLQLAAPFGRDERLLAWAAALEGVLSGG